VLREIQTAIGGARRGQNGETRMSWDRINQVTPKRVALPEDVTKRVLDEIGMRCAYLRINQFDRCRNAPMPGTRYCVIHPVDR
jgi:hypothetical protein